MLRRLLLAAAVICFHATSASAQDAKFNFTGNWTLDVAKSDPQAPESISHEIAHEEPNITVTTTTKAQGDVGVDEQRFTTDGKEHTNRMMLMGAERQVNVTARWRGETLLTSWRFAAHGRTMEFNDSWSLAAGGKVLIFVRVARTPDGDFPLKMVYNKQ